jgi:hypothetical protein
MKMGLIPIWILLVFGSNPVELEKDPFAKEKSSNWTNSNLKYKLSMLCFVLNLSVPKYTVTIGITACYIQSTPSWVCSSDVWLGVAIFAQFQKTDNGKSIIFLTVVLRVCREAEPWH